MNIVDFSFFLQKWYVIVSDNTYFYCEDELPMLLYLLHLKNCFKWFCFKPLILL